MVIYHAAVDSSEGFGESMSDWITARRFHESKGVGDWRVVGEGGCTYFRTGSFASGAQLVNANSELPCLEDHHPGVEVRHQGGIVGLINGAPGCLRLSRGDPRL